MDSIIKELEYLTGRTVANTRSVIQDYASEMCGDAMREALDVLFGAIDTKEAVQKLKEEAKGYIPKPVPKKPGRKPALKKT